MAYYINLDSRPDRRAEIEAELSRLGIEATRFAAIHEPYGGVGCLKSHLGVLQAARAAGLPQVIIVEDDFEVTVSKDEFWQRVHAAPAYDVLMLVCGLNSGETLDNGLVKVHAAQNGAGYIVNASMYDRLIAVFESHLPLLQKTGAHWLHANDQCWKPLQRESVWYGFSPPIARQRASPSDHALKN